MLVVRCIQAEQFLEALRSIAASPLPLPARVRKRHVYRGHGNADWKLQPRAFRSGTCFFTDHGWETLGEYERRWELSSNPPASHVLAVRRSVGAGYRLKTLEIETLMAFFSLADEAGLPLPEDSQVIRAKLQEIQEHSEGYPDWPPLEVRSILALAQHHGLPTRLLDWTWDWRVAAFFAAKDNFDERNFVAGARPPTFGVWALDVADLTLSMRIRSGAPTFSNSQDDLRMLARTRSRIHLVTAPGAANPNLRAQKGLFTLLEEGVADHISDDTPLEELSTEDFGETLSDDLEVNLTEYVLGSECAGQVLSLLAQDGITAAAVYPGYSGVVTSMRDQALWTK